MTKLKWIPNSIMNINVFEYFDNVYISDSAKKCFIYSWIGKYLINCIFKTDQRCNQSSSNIHDGIFDKKTVSNINLNSLTILARKLISDAWLGPGRISLDWYITFLKIQTKICIQTKTVKDYFHLKFKSLVDH